MNETKGYLRAASADSECDSAPLSEVDDQLSDLNSANDYLDSIITDLERALASVLRDNYENKCAESAPEPPLVPVATAIRTNVRFMREYIVRIRTIINRLGV